ncbi:unnamed protein product [Victoria cruziana]
MHLFLGKLKSRWEGPAIVQHVHPSGAVKVKLGRNHFSVNGQRLKPYIDEAIEPAPEESIELIDVDNVVLQRNLGSKSSVSYCLAWSKRRSLQGDPT